MFFLFGCFFHFLQSLFHLFNTSSFIIKGFANKIIRCIEVDKNKGKSKIKTVIHSLPFTSLHHASTHICSYIYLEHESALHDICLSTDLCGFFCSSKGATRLASVQVIEND